MWLSRAQSLAWREARKFAVLIEDPAHDLAVSVHVCSAEHAWMMRCSKIAGLHSHSRQGADLALGCRCARR